MNPAVLGIVAILLIGLGVGIYFLVTAKKCKDHKTQDDCKEPCQWDTYGNKCIDEGDDLTDAPVSTPTPPGCSSYTSEDTCLSPCEWNSSTNTCGTGQLQGAPSASKLIDGGNTWQAEGGHNIFLDRQDVDCGRLGINEIKYERQLSRPNDPTSLTGQAKYKLKCHDDFKSNRGGDQHTPLTPHGDGSVIWLDQQNINCGDRALKRFFLRRGPSPPAEDGTPGAFDRINYLYNCGTRNLKNCEDKTTAWVDESGQYQEVLAKLSVSCPSDKVVTRMQLARERTLADGLTGNVRYEYRCCGK
ncbi:hypothetical protein [Dishui Lake phycodnavirus 2]|nr:hypothetical protein [Dishui Lake phycodnavirus 2]